jgi:sortase A
MLRKRKRRKYSSRKRILSVPNLLIALGLVVIVIGGFSLSSEIRMPGSDVDEFGGPQDDQGFVPYLEPVSNGSKSTDVESIQALGEESETQLDPELTSQEASQSSQREKDAQADNPEVAQSEHRTVVPDRILIPSINLDAPITAADRVEIQINGKRYVQWAAPEYFAVGWHQSSAGLGSPGNTVFNGHHNIYGEVFKDLENIEQGDIIFLFSEGENYIYQVTVKRILEERAQSLEVRLKNAEWIQLTSDERITLVTCWPYTNNTHRLIVVAKPTNMEELNFELSTN